jgi:hypothetical protein
MEVQIQYINSGRTVTRRIEFDGPETDLIQKWNEALANWASTDNRFKTVGGSNADLQAAQTVGT